MRRRSSFSNRSSSRRETTWARGSGGVTFAAPGYETFDLLNDFKTAGGVSQGVTVTRTLLYLSVASVPAAGDVLGLGILRGQNTDVGLNIAGAPRPIAQEFEDWAWWMTPIAFGGSLATGYFEHGLGMVYTIDLRAQRRIPELQMNWNLVIQGTAGNEIVNWYANTLLKLP